MDFHLWHSRQNLAAFRGRLAFAPTESDGEFILKPVPRGLTGVLDLLDDVPPANEHVTMQIAGQIFGLRTAACGLSSFPMVSLRTSRGGLTVTRRRAGSSRRRISASLPGKSRATHGENYKYVGSYEGSRPVLRRYCPDRAADSVRLIGS